MMDDKLSSPASSGPQSSTPTAPPDPTERARASMVLSGLGDALGYMRGNIEFCKRAATIERIFDDRGGLDKVDLKHTDWIVSDDTVQHLATTEAIAEFESDPPREVASKQYDDVMRRMAQLHSVSWDDMGNRAPGGTCRRGVAEIRAGAPWNGIQLLHGESTGCGAAMRAMGIGLAYPSSSPLLIAFASDSASLSHNHVHGVLSAVTVAYFTALAFEDVPVEEWPARLISDAMPRTLTYLRDNPHRRREVPSDTELAVFSRTYAQWWHDWVAGTGRATVALLQDPRSRDHYFGALGGGWNAISCTQIAYEAYRLSAGDWPTMVRFAAMHGGDSDSTACMAAAWFGAAHGLRGVVPARVQDLEYHDRLRNVADALLRMRTGSLPASAMAVGTPSAQPSLDAPAPGEPAGPAGQAHEAHASAHAHAAPAAAKPPSTTTSDHVSEVSSAVDEEVDEDRAEVEARTAARAVPHAQGRTDGRTEGHTASHTQVHAEAKVEARAHTLSEDHVHAHSAGHHGDESKHERGAESKYSEATAPDAEVDRDPTPVAALDDANEVESAEVDEQETDEEA